VKFVILKIIISSSDCNNNKI